VLPHLKFIPNYLVPSNLQPQHSGQKSLEKNTTSSLKRKKYDPLKSFSYKHKQSPFMQSETSDENSLQKNRKFLAKKQGKRRKKV